MQTSECTQQLPQSHHRPPPSPRHLTWPPRPCAEFLVGSDVGPFSPQLSTWNSNSNRWGRSKQLFYILTERIVNSKASKWHCIRQYVSTVLIIVCVNTNRRQYAWHGGMTVHCNDTLQLTDISCAHCKSSWSLIDNQYSCKTWLLHHMLLLIFYCLDIIKLFSYLL